MSIDVLDLYNDQKFTTPIYPLYSNTVCTYIILFMFARYQFEPQIAAGPGMVNCGVLGSKSNRHCFVFQYSRMGYMSTLYSHAQSVLKHSLRTN